MEIFTRENHTLAWAFLFSYDSSLERVEIEEDGGVVLYFDDTDEPYSETCFTQNSPTRILIEDAKNYV